MFEAYSYRARQVVFLARLKAGRRGGEAVEVEDLLVALIIEDQGELAKVLSDLLAHGGLAAQAAPRPHRAFLPPDLASDLLARVEALCTPSQPVPNKSDLPVSESVHHIFALAASLRDELQQSEIGPLHLLAILGDQSSRGAQIFRQAGITREKVVQFLRGAT